MRYTLLLVALLLVGCPSSEDETRVAEVCTRTGDQCRISGSKLGVCMMAVDGAFSCASQH